MNIRAIGMAITMILLVSCSKEVEQHAGDGVVAQDMAADAGAADLDAGPDGMPLEIVWVALPSGEFLMGSDDRPESQPVHLVTVGAFEMSRTEITVAQYRACLADGPCLELDRSASSLCNLDHADRERHPVNCVRKTDASVFADWVGARLPTEAEWEYAARGAGQDRRYPWGDEPVDCGRAVITETPGVGLLGRSGCDLDSTWPVCSKSEGDTSQGVCDMVGNVAEWAEDEYCGDYESASHDGTATGCESRRSVIRGGSWIGREGWATTTTRNAAGAASYAHAIGIRLVRDIQ